MSEETCTCPCHSHPGSYFCEPCSVCGHYNSQGEWRGSLPYGRWHKTRYTHKEILDALEEKTSKDSRGKKVR